MAFTSADYWRSGWANQNDPLLDMNLFTLGTSTTLTQQEVADTLAGLTVLKPEIETFTPGLGLPWIQYRKQAGFLITAPPRNKPEWSSLTTLQSNLTNLLSDPDALIETFKPTETPWFVEDLSYASWNANLPGAQFEVSLTAEEQAYGDALVFDRLVDSGGYGNVGPGTQLPLSESYWKQADWYFPKDDQYEAFNAAVLGLFSDRRIGVTDTQLNETVLRLTTTFLDGAFTIFQTNWILDGFVLTSRYDVVESEELAAYHGPGNPHIGGLGYTYSSTDLSECTWSDQFKLYSTRHKYISGFGSEVAGGEYSRRTELFISLDPFACVDANMIAAFNAMTPMSGDAYENLDVEDRWRFFGEIQDRPDLPYTPKFKPMPGSSAEPGYKRAQREAAGMSDATAQAAWRESIDAELSRHFPPENYFQFEQDSWNDED